MAYCRNLSNGKAAGPSGISNEMIKHLSDDMQIILWKFVCSCIANKDIPDAWRLANIYPILKPKPWDCSLNNTRPITLLENTRKIMVSILTHRLSSIISTHHVLKGNVYLNFRLLNRFESLMNLSRMLMKNKKNYEFCHKTYPRRTIE